LWEQHLPRENPIVSFCPEFLNDTSLEPLDYKKAAILFACFCVVGPAIGYLIRNRPFLQKATFLAMSVLMISGFFHAQEWGLTIYSQLYRGTARGFHFYWAEAAAVVLIFARMTGNWRQFRFLPPGLWLYLLYCVAGLISISNAPAETYTWFAFCKALKLSLIFVAAYNFFKTEQDLRFGLTCIGCVMLWELVVVLDQKYVKHIYQVWGTFEHQNSLCMFTILIGMVLLSAGLGPRQRFSNFFLVAYITCAAIVQSTLSRAGLVIFAFGTVLVIALSLMDQVTKRRMIVLSALTCVGIVGLTMTADTIVQRYKDYGNQESSNTRRMLNISSRMMLTEYPLGIGWNNFAQVINRPYYYGDHIDRWQRINGNTIDPKYKKGVVESLWWLLLSETGYQGFVTYLLFILLFVWWNIRNVFYYRRRTLGAISIGLLVGSLMNYGQSFLERVLVQPRNAILWLILLAATARITTWRKREIKVRRRYWRLRRQQLIRKKFPALPERALAA
jgi:hypothetical protein